MKYGYIYKTKNKLDNRIYIGQKKGMFKPNYFGSGKHLKLAIAKYGEPRFKIELIAYAKTQKQLDKLEQKYIASYRKILGIDNLYNISDGGRDYRIMRGKFNPMYGVPCPTKHHTKATKKKIAFLAHLRWQAGIYSSLKIRKSFGKKGKIPWNKGLNKFVDIRIAKYGETRRKNNKEFKKC